MKSSKTAARVLLVAGFAYLVSVTQRTSLGVAGLEATERFGTTALQLSSLAVFQLVVYAAMQIPVGVLLDRYGSRILVTIGAVLMAVGQLLVATADELAVAVLGRAVLGMGDAFTFISVLRLVHGWYPGPRSAILQQWVGNLGQLGQILSAVPFAVLLSLSGWTVAYTALGSFALLVAALSFLLIKDPALAKTEKNWKESMAELAENVRFPGARMAFWVHFTTQPSAVTFGLLWGYPFLVEAQGFSEVFASGVLVFMVLTGVLMGAILGRFTARFPHHRLDIITITMFAILISWLLVLLVPAPVPVALLGLMVICITFGGPVAFLAFEYSAQLIPEVRRGSANGFINVGGFFAALMIIASVGLLLDWSLVNGISESRYGIDGFRVAMVAQALILGFGLVMVFVEHSRMQKLLYTGIELLPFVLRLVQKNRKK